MPEKKDLRIYVNAQTLTHIYKRLMKYPCLRKYKSKCNPRTILQKGWTIEKILKVDVYLRDIINGYKID